MAQKLMLKRNGSLENAHVTSEHFSFLLPFFESGFRCSRKGGPPVVWIISLYL